MLPISRMKGSTARIRRIDVEITYAYQLLSVCTEFEEYVPSDNDELNSSNAAFFTDVSRGKAASAILVDRVKCDILKAVKYLRLFEKLSILLLFIDFFHVVKLKKMLNAFD